MVAKQGHHRGGCGAQYSAIARVSVRLEIHRSVWVFELQPNQNGGGPR